MLETDPGYGVTHNAEDIRALLMASQGHLWIQWDEDNKNVDAVVVTLFQSYPRGLFLNCWVTAAMPDVKVDWPTVQTAIVGWAKKHKCIGLLGQGRVGWMRKFSGVEAGGQLIRMVF